MRIFLLNKSMLDAIRNSDLVFGSFYHLMLYIVWRLETLFKLDNVFISRGENAFLTTQFRSETCASSSRKISFARPNRNAVCILKGIVELPMINVYKGALPGGWSDTKAHYDRSFRMEGTDRGTSFLRRFIRSFVGFRM